VTDAFWQKEFRDEDSAAANLAEAAENQRKTKERLANNNQLLRAATLGFMSSIEDVAVGGDGSVGNKVALRFAFDGWVEAYRLGRLTKESKDNEAS
jgi:hypothetical protein